MKKERDNFFSNEKVKKTLPKVLAVIKLLVLAGIILGIPFYMYVYHKDWLTMLKDVDEFKEVVRHSFNGPLVVLSAQIIQIIIAISHLLICFYFKYLTFSNKYRIYMPKATMSV